MFPSCGRQFSVQRPGILHPPSDKSPLLGMQGGPPAVTARLGVLGLLVPDFGVVLGQELTHVRHTSV